MGPKRDKNKKEKMRQARRQGDPDFTGPSATQPPSSSSSAPQQPSRIPRPSILLSGRQKSPPQAAQQQQSQERHIAKDAVSIEPQVATAASNRSSSSSPSKTNSGKGLRVTFDLSKNRQDEPEVVAESWEDLSGDEGGHEYEITKDDLIDCEKEFGDLGDELLDFGQGTSPVVPAPFGVVGGGIEDGSANFLINPRTSSGLNDLEDFGAIGEDDGDGSDYDNVESTKSYNGVPHVRYFSDVIKVPVAPVNDVKPVIGLDAIPEDDLPKANQPFFFNRGPPEISVTYRTGNGARDKINDNGNDKTIPFIDGNEEADDDDDEWETELSGSSGDSGKVYQIDNSYAANTLGPFPQSVRKEPDIPFFKAVFDDGTLSRQPCLGKEDDRDIITNEDLDAAFHSVMKEDEDAPPERLFGEKKDSSGLERLYNPFPVPSVEQECEFDYGFPKDECNTIQMEEASGENPEKIIQINQVGTKPEILQADFTEKILGLNRDSGIETDGDYKETVNEEENTPISVPSSHLCNSEQKDNANANPELPSHTPGVSLGEDEIDKIEKEPEDTQTDYSDQMSELTEVTDSKLSVDKQVDTCTKLENNTFGTSDEIKDKMEVDKIDNDNYQMLPDREIDDSNETKLNDKSIVDENLEVNATQSNEPAHSDESVFMQIPDSLKEMPEKTQPDWKVDYSHEMKSSEKSVEDENLEIKATLVKEPAHSDEPLFLQIPDSLKEIPEKLQPEKEVDDNHETRFSDKSMEDENLEVNATHMKEPVHSDESVFMQISENLKELPEKILTDRKVDDNHETKFSEKSIEDENLEFNATNAIQSAHAGESIFLQNPENLKEMPEKYQESEESCIMNDPPESFIGPIEREEAPKEPSQSTYPKARADSPEVSIGFECHKEKPKCINNSETESEGELVIGEDKCVGTTDDKSLSEEEPLDLSERTLSKCETMSESRDSLSLRSEDESQSESGNLATDMGKHEVIANSGTSCLDVPKGDRVDISPSPEIPADAPIGNSESAKEKEKKNGKKKGKKNKRDGKLEHSKAEVIHPDRPRLVRGRSWKEKKDKLKLQPGDGVSLLFGNELCESEIVEGTSNLLTETYTEASLLTASRCSTETTIVTETPCTACSSITGEFNETEKKRPADAIAQVTEMKMCDEKLCHTPTITQLPNIKLEVTAAPEGSIHDEQKDDFFVVKACEVAVPLEVLTEYVPDSESSEDTNGLPMDDKHKSKTVDDSSGSQSAVESIKSDDDSSRNIQVVPTRSSPSNSGGEPEVFVDSSNSNSSDDQNPAYFDAKDSSCTDKVTQSYDYVESFPSVIGTQSLSYIYSYDDDEYVRQTDRPKLTVKPLNPSLESSGVMMVNVGENETCLDTPPLTSGEIIYEGPCMCGPGEKTGIEKGRTNEDIVCVPPLFISSNNGRTVGDGAETNSEIQEFKTEIMVSYPEENPGSPEDDQQDIRSRIKEIVGPRLHQKRGRHTARRRGGGGDGSVGSSSLSPDQGYTFDPDGVEGRDESPMPGSSPASSSGVQGSDEMSPSRSHSHSPSREDSVSPPSTTDCVSDIAFEAYQVQEVPLISEGGGDNPVKEGGTLLAGGSSVESSPEKGGGNQVDYSFKSFRDMYQINPVYTTDSDDHDDQNESDTVVQSSPGLSYDPDRSITVSSLGSSPEEFPAPQETGTTPPLPPVGRGPRKVPKVTKQLRETQGIVQRWEVLQAQAVERQRQGGQVRELQRQVKTMRMTLESLADQANEGSQTEVLGTHKELDLKLQDAKGLLEEVRSRKTEVSSLNLAVHRFFTDSGYSLAQLKDEVNDLYILFDEAHRRAASEVSRLEGLEATWKLWEAEADELTRALRQDGDTLKVLDAAIQTGSLTDSVTASMQDVAKLLNERRKTQQPGGKKLSLQHTRTQGVDIQGSTLSLGTSGDDCLSDSGTSGYESCSSEELSERERRLAHLRRLARDLEASLSPDSQAWLAITKTLSSAEMELKDLQKHCRDLVVRSTGTLEQTRTPSPQLRRRNWIKDSKAGRVTRGDRRTGGRSDSSRSNGRRGWMWRVVRAALPFQAALLLLFCVACLLEPNCCDSHNSLTMTLTPQLRYVHGPPPV